MAKETKWRVTGQQEGTRPDNTGRFVTGVTVSFQTDGGLSGSVFVPDSRYTPEVVRDEIADRVERMQAVADLSG